MQGPEPSVAGFTLAEPVNLLDAWNHKIATSKHQTPTAVKTVLDRGQRLNPQNDHDTLHTIGQIEVTRKSPGINAIRGHKGGLMGLPA